MNTQCHTSDDFVSNEHWAMNRAHQIVVHEGMSLVTAAQQLDRKRMSVHTYALRKAIMDCLLEALQYEREASGRQTAGLLTES